MRSHIRLFVALLVVLLGGFEEAHAGNGMIQLGAEAAQFASPAPATCSKVTTTASNYTNTSINCTSSGSDVKFYLPVAIPPDYTGGAGIFTSVYYTSPDPFTNRRCYWALAISALRDGATAASLDATTVFTAGPQVQHVSSRRYWAQNNVIAYDVLAGANCSGSNCSDTEAILEVTLRASPNTSATQCNFDFVTLRY